MNMIVNKFYKFMKSRKSISNFASNTRGNKRRNKVAVPTCYECEKEGHIKLDCLVLKMKQKFDEKTNQDRRKDRQKKAYIARKDSDSSNSSSDDDQSLEEETNLCLMADSVCSESNGCNFDDKPIEARYYQLLSAIKELHAEVMKMQYQVNRSKSEKRDLEHKIDNLIYDNECLKTNLETALESLKKAKSEVKTVV